MHRLKTQTLNSQYKNLTVDFSAFADFLNFFNEINIFIIRIVILTVYNTWAKKSLKVISMLHKKIMIETATNNHSKQIFFKVIDSNNFVNDSEKSNDKILSKNNNIINNENKWYFRIYFI